MPTVALVFLCGNALLLLSAASELIDRAVLFFESLAASGSGSSRSAGSAAAGASAANPVYNLLPDCLSALLAKDNPPLLEEQIQVIMTQLLAYVKVGVRLRSVCLGGTTLATACYCCSCALQQEQQAITEASGSM